MRVPGAESRRGTLRALGTGLAVIAWLTLQPGPGSRAHAEANAEGGGAAIPALDPSFESTGHHRVVLILDDDLDPGKLELEEGQLVVWISYARDPSIIVFDREVARDMVCHSLVNFSLRDGALRSNAIEPGEFASFCELKPGEYEYRVTRAPQSAGGTAPKPLRGELRVSKAK